ncbi:SDR family oxidoreductase [Stappia sp. GBMRC 2046]|uniref:SDR family oxidoreductase n=1 Tax=Stappia sediminis TaxID=2692190 RepID=A0A7X3SA67_9HYPH|nr:SDR family oxidoreductase [Stappia sediminis]MXN67500.1 SDR family oxidoreductase [Stappia sediminis]
MIERSPQSLFDLCGKTACVTGASSGLGRRAADVLLGAGASVVGIARRAEALEAWAAEAGEAAGFVVGDLARRDDLIEIARKASQVFGAPDILVNAAGINTREPAGEVTPQGWDTTLDLNLAAPFFLAQAMVPAMREKGWGRVVNFASLQSYRAFPGGLSYGASKGGVTQLTRAMAEAWSNDGITANAIAPGFFRTELTAAVFADPDRAARNAAQTCIGRNGEPSDIDGPILFFCSDASGYVTGQTLMVDGGFTAK